MSGLLSGNLALVQARLATAPAWIALCAAAGVDPEEQIVLGVGGYGADDAFLSAAGGSKPLALPLAQVHLDTDTRQPSGNRRWQRAGAAFLDVVTTSDFGISPDGYLQAVQLAEDLETHFENGTSTTNVFAPMGVDLAAPPLLITTVNAWRGAWVFRLRLSWLQNPRT